MNQRLVATIQLLTVVVAGAFVAVLAKLALSQLPGRLAVPPFTFVWLQIAIGGTLLTAYTFLIRGERIPRKLSKGTWGCLIWIGVSANQFLSNNIISTVALWIGGIPVVLCGFLFDWPPPVFGWQNWTIIAASGVVSIAVGLTVFNYVLRTLRSYEASIFASTSVLFVAVFAVPVLGEKLAVHQLFGIGITLLGLALVQFRRGMLGFSKRSMVNSDPS